MDLRIRLTVRERQLISDFGSPFERLKEQLDPLAHTRAARIVRIDSYFFDLLFADLSRPEHEVQDRRLLVELDELYCRLEVQAMPQRHAVGGVSFNPR